MLDDVLKSVQAKSKKFNQVIKYSLKAVWQLVEQLVLISLML